eukprot:gnl/TRDRNA2_/TRDRNA2_193576_c0_seq1.p1 gnl/TRDRNA2_/TRDRNA2_193576_c0~~gnl/TRDRNA2_/TRDRNA2_193576_c0_seq1.p1  ORF type:complete len:289 (-),score=62.24 gnl/TRDRNA2_/TRDRNA2_193576_c0_seq1:1-867(-)
MENWKPPFAGNLDLLKQRAASGTAQSGRNAPSPVTAGPSANGLQGTTTTDCLRRAGLSMLNNYEFEEKARQEAIQAEEFLRKFKGPSLVARCTAECDAISKQLRAEEEKKIVSERVTRELDAFRKEQRQKEEAEEERLRNVYGNIMDQMITRGTEEQAPVRIRHDFDRPVLATFADLSASPSGTPPWGGGASAAVASSAARAAAAYHYGDSWHSPQEARVTFEDTRMELPSLPYERKLKAARRPLAPAIAEPNPSGGRRHKASAETTEVDSLLRLNLARLERLELLGL